MSADAAATPSSSVSTVQQRIDELTVELRACTGERDEAMQRERALAEVLQAINASSQAPTAVFDAILEKVMHLCAAAFGYLMTFDGERFQVVAAQGLPALGLTDKRYVTDLERPDTSIARLDPAGWGLRRGACRHGARGRAGTGMAARGSRYPRWLGEKIGNSRHTARNQTLGELAGDGPPGIHRGGAGQAPKCLREGW